MGKLLIEILLVLACNLSYGNGEKETPLKYNIESAGTGIEGTYLVKISFYTNKVNVATDNLLRKIAVHGTIFKGANATKEYNLLPALANNPSIEKEKEEFFNHFFKEQGEFLHYASIVQGSLQVIKTNKKEYCISAIATIQKDNLRKHLEKSSIITGFSDMF